MNSAETTDVGANNSAVAAPSHTQRERLTSIEFRLYFSGTIGRPDLLYRFGVAAATRDFARYRELAPNNIRFDERAKRYRLGVAFVALFPHFPQRALTALSQGFGEGRDAEPAPLVASEIPAFLCPPPVDTLAALCRAINAHQPLTIRYNAMSSGNAMGSGESERIIVPFALVDAGPRCNVRAFDRNRQCFRDLLLTRIDAVNAIEESGQPHERPEHDIQWSRILEPELVPHPRPNRPEIIARDYGMTDGALRVRVRAAVAGYMLLRWCVDSSADQHLTGEQYRLWLRDSLTIYGVENARLAHGYQEPAYHTTS